MTTTIMNRTVGTMARRRTMETGGMVQTRNVNVTISNGLSATSMIQNHRQMTMTTQTIIRPVGTVARRRTMEAGGRVQTRNVNVTTSN